MNELQKVLVVDNGNRDSMDALSAELAELGYSSVTASFEAADQVLDVIQRPSAVFLKVPQAKNGSEYQEFLAVADVLRGREDMSDVPVIVWDRNSALAGGGLSALLQSGIAPQMVASPDR